MRDLVCNWRARVLPQWPCGLLPQRLRKRLEIHSHDGFCDFFHSRLKAPADTLPRRLRLQGGKATSDLDRACFPL
ncbi:hypothetical protein Y032_0066g3781 [Ancylostoma ceylanicum]|uniref:Uncharacterized protein n=1 Tax=Ancylostoma ceylanicum TaxID=53326 RepID=A0A016TZI0_9BILA|nr:hypothetical protein Y032_0066g3781 [Ancylostoma ceylanicum]